LGSVVWSSSIRSGVAWARGVNGIASIVASAGAITVAIVAGFPAATVVALACYLVALAYALLAPRPQKPPRPPVSGRSRSGRRRMAVPIEG
jgi:type III secretory pathway component EscV